MSLVHLDHLLSTSDCSVVTLCNWIDGEFVSVINTGSGTYVNHLLSEVGLGGSIGMTALELLLEGAYDFVGKGKTREDSLNDLDRRIGNLIQDTSDSLEHVFTAYDSFNMTLETQGNGQVE